MKRNLLIWFLLFLLILFFYRNIFNSYFEGDEWYYFSIFLPLTHHPFGVIEAIALSFTQSNAISGGGHIAPIYNLLWFLENLFFGLHFKLYILISLLLHTTNSFLLFKFVDSAINRRVALLSGLIFAISAVHYQAITWVMAVIPTQFSLLFSLCGVIALIYGVKQNSHKYLKLSVLLFLSALFTKETAIVIVFLSPVLLVFIGHKFFTKGLVVSITTLAIYLPVRFLVPFFVNGSAINNSHIPLQNLFWYQLLLIERIITEAFVPSNLLFGISKFISENIYFKMITPVIPIGSKELFLETVGSDIVIFVLSPIFVLISIIVIRGFYLRKNNYEVLLFSALTIILSAVPLLFILSYAPWWIDSAFIDSRHLYFPSVGTSILLAYGFVSIGRIRQKKLSQSFILILGAAVFVAWVIIQYVVIQKQISKFKDFGTTRQNILNSIIGKVPQLSDKSIFLVESDTPYYGFANISPFQTNLGQILSIKYYQKNNLPEQFLNGSKFMTKGLLDEGTATFDGVTFGYYSKSGTLFRDLAQDKFTIKDVKSFNWNGSKNELVDNTEILQERMIVLLDSRKRVSAWETLSTPYINIKYPHGSLIQEMSGDDRLITGFIITMPQSETTITVTIVKKDKSITFGAYLPSLKNSDGRPIGNDNSTKNITREDGSIVTIVHVLTGDRARYFLPFGDGTSYMELSAPAVSSDKDISPFISHDIELLIFATHE